jgi:hypothetical protein
MQWMSSLIHVTAWERVSLWRRVPCAFLRVGILLGVVTVLFALLGPPLTIFFTARWEAKKIPYVWVTQQPLVNYAVSESPGTKLSYFGYKFEVPWVGGFKERGGKNGIVELKFDSGQILLLMAPKNQAGLLSEIVEDPSLHMKYLQPVLGELTKRSPYDQYATLLNTTPSSIHAFGSRAEAVRNETLLTIKAISSPAMLRTGAFSFDLPETHGFQIGDPGKERRAQLEVFVKENGNWVEIVCGTKNESVKLTQPEINRILTSFHSETKDFSASVRPSSNTAASTSHSLSVH